MPSLISAVVTTIDSFLRNTVTAAMDLTGPGAPLDSPLAWTILAWTRRPSFNQPPTTNPQQLTENSEGVITGTLGALDAEGEGDGPLLFLEPNNAATPAAVNATATAVTPIVDPDDGVAISSPNTSGAVTVKIVATDPLGRPLTYSVLTPPSPATGAVTPGVTPGEFTYTPTTKARVSAARGPTTDTFTIAVAPTANPNNVLATVTIKAPVAPATITLTVIADKTKTDSVVSTGTLTAKTDPAGIPVAYRVTEGKGPTYGEVHIDPTTGEWTYTPNIEAVKKANRDNFAVYFVDTEEELGPLDPLKSDGSTRLGDPKSPFDDEDSRQCGCNATDGQYQAAIAVDTGTYWEFKFNNSSGQGEWVKEVGGPPRFDTFTITAYDPNASGLRVDSSPIHANFVRLPFHLAPRKTPNTPESKQPQEVFVFPDGYQWKYSASAPVDNAGNVSVDDNGNASEFHINPDTGVWTYTPNATLVKLGGTEIVPITATAIGTDHPTITCLDHECEGIVTFDVKKGGEYTFSFNNPNSGRTDVTLDQASVGISTRSTAVIGTSDYKIGTGIEGPPPPPPQGDVPIVICGGPHILDPTAPPGLCSNPSDAHAEDRPTVTQAQTAPTSGTPSTPTSTVAAGMPVVGAATPASSIEGVPQGDVPGWRENITKDPITTDKYTVQEGDTLSGIAQRWGLGDDRTKNYQDLAKANQGVIGVDPNVIHPGQELTRQT